jgi:hypothetical protein
MADLLILRTDIYRHSLSHDPVKYSLLNARICNSLRSLVHASSPSKDVPWEDIFQTSTAFILYDFNVRGLFLFLYDAIGRSFDRWEIRIAHQIGGMDNQDLPLYQYQELKPRQIRLLRLHRRFLFAPPRCELVQVSLDDPPLYEVIFYTWGCKALDIPLNISRKRVLVTANVEGFLPY